jgi:hypothetical protein
LVGVKRLVVAAIALVTMVPVGADAAPARSEAVIPAHRVFMVADSVGLGAKTAVPAAFPRGWHVTVTGKPAQFVEQLVSKYVQPELAPNTYDSAIVAGGYNYPYWDPPRFARSVDLMVNTLVRKGVKRVFWVTVREVTPANFPRWAGLAGNYKTLYTDYPTTNRILRDATRRHPQLSIIDWNAVSDQVGLTYDAIHLNPVGAARYSALAAQTVITAAQRLPAGTVTKVPVVGFGSVPTDAAAVSLQLGVANPRTAGSVVAWPCGRPRPSVPNLTFEVGQTASVGAIVGVGTDGSVCLYQTADAVLTVDRLGAFTASSGFARVVPTRLTATVARGTTAVLRLGAVKSAPRGAFVGVAAIHLTAPAGADLRVFACGRSPSSSPTISAPPTAPQQVLALLRTDNSGKVCLRASRTVTVTVDLVGSFPADGAITPLAPRRLLDTRTGRATAAGSVTSLPVAGRYGIPTVPGVTGALATVTLWRPLTGATTGVGTASLAPCSSQHHSMALLAVHPNHPRSGSELVAVGSTGKLCLWTSVTSPITVDITGWTGPGFLGTVPRRVYSSQPG